MVAACVAGVMTLSSVAVTGLGMAGDESDFVDDAMNASLIKRQGGRTGRPTASDGNFEATLL